MITIRLKEHLTGEQQHWLQKNVGPRLHYIHNSIGGEGWICKKVIEETVTKNILGHNIGKRDIYWNLTFEDDRYATFFVLNFPQ